MVWEESWDLAPDHRDLDPICTAVLMENPFRLEYWKRSVHEDTAFDAGS